LYLDVIAGSVSQNCGRQPHIVSTNHSNLTAVGPNRSLASRQAIVWTYRPRVEATKSRLPDFLLSGTEPEKFYSRKRDRSKYFYCRYMCRDTVMAVLCVLYRVIGSIFISSCYFSTEIRSLC
jgi:hypothetical protein